MKRLLGGLVSVLMSSALGMRIASANEIKANIFFPAQHPLAKHGYVEWAESLKELSGGQLSAKVFTGTVLLPPRSGMSGVRDGIVTVGYHAATYTPAELPVTNAIQEMGFNYSDPLVMIAAATDFNTSNPDALKQWHNAGVVFTGGYSTPSYNLMCRNPVQSLADLKGKRLRTAGAAMSRWVEKIGAVPVNVPSSEMYQGVEKGTLDCAVNVANDLKSRSLWDVAKHTTMAPLGLYWSGPMWAFNASYWQEISPEARALYFKANARAMARLYVGYKDAVDEALSEAADHGVKVYEAPQDILNSIRDFAKANLSEVYKKGEEKYGLKNSEEILTSFDATVKKWEALFASADRKDAIAIEKIIYDNLFAKLDPATFGVN